MTLLTTLLATMKYMSRPKSTAVKDIDIADILGQKCRYLIDIGKGDVDTPLVYMMNCHSFKDGIPTYHSQESLMSH